MGNEGDFMTNRVIEQTTLPSGQGLFLVRGDITREQVDAIVNAANQYLHHGGGVAGAIAQRGGKQVQDESDEWVRNHGPVTHGSPAYTGGGNLQCKYIIHTVGPIWGSGDEDAKLEAAVYGSLNRAEELNLQSLALPAISTGIFGFPKGRAATVILKAIQNYFLDHPESGLEEIHITIVDRPTLDVFRKVWMEMGFSQRD
jgi:putative ATPase